MHKLIGLLSMATLLLLGCAATERQTRPFDDVVLDYMQRLRWHDWNGAAQHIPEEERDPFLQRMLEGEDLRMTDVRLEGVELQGDGTRAATRIAFEYYRLPSPTVKTVRAKQEWAYAEGDRTRPGGWRVLIPLPPLP